MGSIRHCCISRFSLSVTPLASEFQVGQSQLLLDLLVYLSHHPVVVPVGEGRRPGAEFFRRLVDRFPLTDPFPRPHDQLRPGPVGPWQVVLDMVRQGLSHAFQRVVEAVPFVAPAPAPVPVYGLLQDPDPRFPGVALRPPGFVEPQVLFVLLEDVQGVFLTVPRLVDPRRCPGGAGQGLDARAGWHVVPPGHCSFRHPGELFQQSPFLPG